MNDVPNQVVLIDRAIHASAVQHLEMLAATRVEGAGDARRGQAERWTVARILLALLGDADQREPLSLVHRDRPDFMLRIAERAIGIEITRAISENLANTYRHESGTIDLSLPDLRWGAATKSWSELQPALAGAGEGFIDDEVTQEWLCGVIGCIQAKREKDWLGTFDERWLFVYQDLGLPMVDDEELPGLARGISRASFERVCVLSDHHVVDLAADGVRLFSVSDASRASLPRTR